MARQGWWFRGRADVSIFRNTLVEGTSKNCGSPSFSICVSVYGGSDNSELIIIAHSYSYNICFKLKHILILPKFLVDKVSHQLLVEKLHSFNIPVQIIEWIKNFLTVRKQQVTRLNDATSDSQLVRLGLFLLKSFLMIPASIWWVLGILILIGLQSCKNIIALVFHVLNTFWYWECIFLGNYLFLSHVLVEA